MASLRHRDAAPTPPTPQQPVGRRFAIRAAMAGVLTAAAAAITGAARPEPAAALAGPIEYSSGTGQPTIEGDNTGSDAGVEGTSVSGYGVVGHGGPWGGSFTGTTGGVTATSAGDGLVGNTSGSGATAGVRGVSSVNDGNGIIGECDVGTLAQGVVGISNTGVGLVGQGGPYGCYAVGSTVGVEGEGVPGAGDGVDGLTHGDATTAGVRGHSTTANGNGVIGECDSGTLAIGVQGLSATGFGVIGRGAGPFGVYGIGSQTGVWGQNTGNSGTAGVQGDSFGAFPGVLGTSDGVTPARGITAGVFGTGAHTGVLGTTPSITQAGVEGDGVAIGVQGISTTTGGNTGYGVRGVANNGAGSAGVLGYAPNGVGYGFYGYSTSGSAAGALCYNTTTSGYGLQAYNGGAGTGYAAVFGSASIPHSGNVLVQGIITQLGGAPTIAAPDASGSLRRLYGLVSPESWFEDFGSGQLSGGSASIALESTFAQMIASDDYHVFVTPEDAWTGLYVTNKTSTGFVVREAGGGGTSDKNAGGGSGGGVKFSYRVVARGQATAAVRLERVEAPPATLPPAVAEVSPAVTPAAIAASAAAIRPATEPAADKPLPPPLAPFPRKPTGPPPGAGGV